MPQIYQNTASANYRAVSRSTANGIAPNYVIERNGKQVQIGNGFQIWGTKNPTKFSTYAAAELALKSCGRAKIIAMR